jgi:thiol-disulfide isomerase/thioredoxin
MLNYKHKGKQAIILVALLHIGLVEPTHATGAIEPYEGNQKQPGFTLPDLDQQLHRLADYKGKVVLINFWASWCTPCMTEMPGIQRLADALTDQPFEILAINVSEAENRIRESLKRMNLNLTVLLDRNGEVFKAWHGKVLPASYLVDGNGMIRYRVIGPMEWDSDATQKIIKALIKNQ